MTAERVLVVDDEASIIQLARLYLERDGYQVLTAGDGLSALKAAAEEKPAFARQIVLAHQRNIWVESQPGLGSRFIVQLPRTRAPEQDSRPQR